MVRATLAAHEEVLAARNDFGLLQELPAGTWMRGGAAALTVGCAALAAWPFCSGVYGDQFSYARTVYDFIRTGHLVYNGWGNPLLGWQIVWAELFIRIFGFSFDALRLSVLCLGVLSIALFHQILARFGLSRQLAFFGALTLGLTPLFFPLAVGFLSDIPGLFVTLLCLALCQRAIIAPTTGRAAVWLGTAAATNVIGGTARQICWLGVLVMVPCTTWLLRRQRGVLLTGCVCTLLGAIAIRSLLHWFLAHPHATPEHLNLRATNLRALGRLGQAEVRSALFLVLITAPVGVALLGLVRHMGRATLLRVAVIVCTVALVLLVAGGRDAFDSWSLPWLLPTLIVQGLGSSGAIPASLLMGVRVGISLATLALALLVGEMAIRFWPRQGDAELQNGAMFWLLVPFSVAMLASMASRGMFFIVQDRYLLQLVPALLIGLLWLLQGKVSARVPPFSVALLCVFAVYGMAALHDMFASARAVEAVSAELRGAGVSRENVSEGFGPDEWFEVDRKGLVNNVTAAPADYASYAPNRADWHLPNACMPVDYDLIPSLHPLYVIGTAGAGADLLPCYRSSRFKTVPFRSWLTFTRREAFAGVPAGKPPGERPYTRNLWGAK